MQKIALLIGVSEYAPGLPPLPGAAKDVEAMRRVLQDPDMGGFDQVKALINPDLVTMQDEIEALFVDRQRNDLVLLFFSGHGITDNCGKFYFTTAETCKNARGDIALARTVRASYVHEAMSNSACKQQVVILDCCFSGAFPTGMTAKDNGVVNVQAQLGGEGRAILASSTATQYSFEQANSDLSVYTHYLVKGIETGAADADGDGRISVWELHQYAKQNVQASAPTMKPEIYPTQEGSQIILASAPVWDAKLNSRRVIEHLVRQGELSNKGRISRSSRKILKALREGWKLSSKEALLIEAEVLQPHQEYRKKLQRLHELLQSVPRSDRALNNRTHSILVRLQEVWNLRPEDVELIASNVAKQRSWFKSLCFIVLGVGTAMSVTTVGILYFRLHDRLFEKLPPNIQAVLDTPKKTFESTMTDLRLQLIHKPTDSQSNLLLEVLRKVVDAEKQIEQTEQLIRQADSQQDWKNVTIQWQQASHDLQKVIDDLNAVLTQLETNNPDRQTILDYRDHLQRSQKRAKLEILFPQAMRKAEQALHQQRQAKSLKARKSAGELWHQASQQMSKIPQDSVHFQQAQVKAREYKSYSSLLVSKNSNRRLTKRR